MSGEVEVFDSNGHFTPTTLHRLLIGDRSIDSHMEEIDEHLGQCPFVCRRTMIEHLETCQSCRERGASNGVTPDDLREAANLG